MNEEAVREIEEVLWRFPFHLKERDIPVIKKILTAIINHYRGGKDIIGKCFCEEIEAQTYENEVILSVPENITLFYNDGENNNARETVSVDACLVGEIKYLWRRGIRTTGCCCGHNKNTHAFISVIKEDIPKMESLGYIIAPNPLDAERRDSFRPKSVIGFYTSETTFDKLLGDLK